MMSKILNPRTASAIRNYMSTAPPCLASLLRAFNPTAALSPISTAPRSPASMPSSHAVPYANKLQSIVASAMETSVAEDLAEIEARHEENVMPTYGYFQLAFAHGKGSYLYDTTGKEYLDFAAGISTYCLGHGNPKLAEVVAQQMSLSHLFDITQHAALEEWLVRTSGADKAFFCNSGAEANEGAIKLARQHAMDRGITEPVIVTARGSFNGCTLGALNTTGQPKYEKDKAPVLPGFEYVHYNDGADLEAIVDRLVAARASGSSQGLAAIMLEPLQGEGGIRPGSADFFNKARELCDEHGALLILDEVQTGVARTGKLWGHQQLGVTPDIFTSAKALGGGVPIGVMLAKGVAATVFGPGDHASTFGGNPLACAAGLAVAQEIEGVDGSFAMLDQVASRGEVLRAGLDSIAASHPGMVKDVRGWGLINGIELEDKDGVPTAAAVVAQAIQRGLLLVPAGARVVRFVPALIVSEEDIAKALERFSLALHAATEELKADAKGVVLTHLPQYEIQNDGNGEVLWDGLPCIAGGFIDCQQLQPAGC
mmetsp:Transcript_48431/g.85365  ORF Transcript_48431/g.85365 Transcript_48431/m.85365 type:complete len:541 (+) Transcript_48431:102-1724(+)